MLLRHSLLKNVEMYLLERTGKPLPNHPPRKHDRTAEENEHGGSADY